MPPTIADLTGCNLGTSECSYDERDVMLYALSVGARADELPLVYERDLRVLPTFAVTLGLWAVWAAAALGVYDKDTTLHASQRLSILQPLPPTGTFPSSGTVAKVWDKGSSALVDIEVTSQYFVSTYTIFVPGAGGFGGERGSFTSQPLPEEHDMIRSRIDIDPNQAVLYRLTGDRHPVHVDPDTARRVGLQGPILHGMCLFGSLMLEASRLLQRDPSTLIEADVRMSAVVYPGSHCIVDVWPRDDRFGYRGSVEDQSVMSGWGRFSS